MQNPPADEESPCNPTNVYEKTKLAGGKAGLDFARTSRFPVVALVLRVIVREGRKGSITVLRGLLRGARDFIRPSE